MLATNVRDELAIVHQALFFIEPHRDSDVSVRANWDMDFLDVGVRHHEDGSCFSYFRIKAILFTVGKVSDLPYLIPLDVWSQWFLDHRFSYIPDGVHSLVENNVTNVVVE